MKPLRDIEAPVAAPDPGMNGTRPEGPGWTFGDVFASFLGDSDVERDFHEARALHDRARIAAASQQELDGRARSAENLAASLERRADPERKRKLEHGTGVLLACGLALLDSIPAYLAAETFGFDHLTTLGVTVLFVAALAAEMWGLAHYQTGWQRWAALAALGLGLMLMALLRWQFLIVTVGPDPSSFLQAVGLTVVTGGLVWLGVVVFGLTRSCEVSEARRRARHLRDLHQRAGMAAETLERQASGATRELTGRAIVFARRHPLATVEDRERLAAGFEGYVKAEITR